MTKQEIEAQREREADKALLTPDVIKRKLKHIAGLCYALCCDLSNMQSEIEELREENEVLKDKLSHAPKRKYTRSAEDREKKSQRMKEYWAKRRAEQNGVPPEG